MPAGSSMMTMPLQISSLIRHADRVHGDVQIATAANGEVVHRQTWSDTHRRSSQLAASLLALGISAGERVATMAWSSHRHLEIYYAVTGIGAVCHTVNPKLFVEQVRYTMQHAEDAAVFVDLDFVPLLLQILPDCPSLRHIVLLEDDPEALRLIPTAISYEQFLAQGDEDFEWPGFDENAGAYLSYTSGTTGNPKGVLYSHRSTILHTWAQSLPDAMNLRSQDVIAPVIQFFHVNAFGLPCAAAMVGAKLVFPGAAVDAASLYALFESEQVTMSAAVPTLWQQMLNHLEANNCQLNTLERIVVGGSACPPKLMHAYQKQYGIKIRHVWGMTETSPLGVTNAFKAKHENIGEEQRYAVQAKQGRPLFGVEMKIVDSEQKELPRDGRAAGDIVVRGPWICREYYRSDAPALNEDGWFMTGDVGTLDPDGYMQITDRSKDVIKTGGEWISSIALENIALSHDSIADAAVIAVPHPKWDERPLLVAVLKPGSSAKPDQILAHFNGKVAKWWIPDDVVFADSLPYTATGKIDKKRIREQWRKQKPIKQ